MITNITNDTTSNVVETSLETSAVTAQNLTRQFQCSLNPVTQLDKIINDAHLPNFKLEVNNSGFNVNIRCNSGTYARVVKPTIATIDNEFSATANEYFCNFSRRPAGVDQNNLDFNDIITVSIHKCSIPTIVVANVTITAHHSSRNVQLQSSSMLGDITAPLWVTRHILLKTFENVAEKKKIEIEQFNSEVLALVNKSNPITSICSGCKKKFSSGSKPIKCSQCSAFFHTGCTTTKRRIAIFTCSTCTVSIAENSPPLHSLVKRSRSDQNPETVPIIDDLSEYDPDNQRPRRVAIRRLSSSSTVPVSTSALAPYTSAALSSSSVVATALPTPPTVMIPSTSTGASPFIIASSYSLTSSSSIPSLAPSNPATKSSNTGAKSKTSKNKTTIPTSPRSFQHEQTKIELDIVRTKLKQTETLLKDKNEMNDILTARNKLFEEKRVSDAHSDLFNNKTTQQPSPSCPVPTPPSPSTSNTSSSNSNQTMEALIQLELIKTLRGSSPPVPTPQPCNYSPPSSPPPPPAPPQSCSCSPKLDLLQDSLSQITNMLALLNKQVLALEATVSTSTSRVSTTLPPSVESTPTSPKSSTSSPSSALPPNFDPTIPPPSITAPPPPTQFKPKSKLAPRRTLLPTPPSPATALPTSRPPSSTIAPPSSQYNPVARRALLPTPYPLTRPFLLPTPPSRLFHTLCIPNRVSHNNRNRRNSSHRHHASRKRDSKPSTSASIPSTSVTTSTDIAPNEIIEDILDSIFTRSPTTSIDPDIDCSVRSLDDPVLSDELGDPLN